MSVTLLWHREVGPILILLRVVIPLLLLLASRVDDHVLTVVLTSGVSNGGSVHGLSLQGATGVKGVKGQGGQVGLGSRRPRVKGVKGQGAQGLKVNLVSAYCNYFQ
jgi:hypothetical protein